MPDESRLKEYKGPAGGWGSLKSVESILTREGRLVKGNVALFHQNKPGGFTCVSCAWAKPDKPRL